jgi:hypothetical protein
VTRLHTRTTSHFDRKLPRFTHSSTQYGYIYTIYYFFSHTLLSLHCFVHFTLFYIVHLHRSICLLYYFFIVRDILQDSTRSFLENNKLCLRWVITLPSENITIWCTILRLQLTILLHQAGILETTTDDGPALVYPLPNCME